MQLVTEDNITELAKQRWGTAHDERTRELLTGLVQHLHDFAREVRLTEAEWMAAIQWLKRTGQISDEKREEFILASDVLGLSMLVVQMNHRFDPAATPATVLGPFHIDGSPELDYGGDMSEGLPGVPALRQRDRPQPGRHAGRRRGARRLAGRRGRRLRGAAPGRRGPAAREVHRSRGRHLLPPHHRTQGLLDPDGRPGRRADRADRHQPLPARRTCTSCSTCPGFRPLITHLFEEGAEYLDSDVVFGTKQELVVGYEHHEPGPDARRRHQRRAVGVGDLRLRPAARP